MQWSLITMGIIVLFVFGIVYSVIKAIILLTGALFAKIHSKSKLST